MSKNGDLTGILRDLVVLSLFAAALIGIAAVVLRRRLSTGAGT
ncbi:hypothetical protein [Streptomyces sp. cg40]